MKCKVDGCGKGDEQVSKAINIKDIAIDWQKNIVKRIDNSE